MKFVMDTSALIAGLRSPSGAAAELLRLTLLGRAEMLASVPLFIEYEAVAMREEHLSAAGLSRDELGALLDALAKTVRPVDIKFLWRPQLRAPDDEMVLEAAINGGADAIVTFNVRDFAASAARFGVTPLSPSEALVHLSSSPPYKRGG
jgi:putative PIN family toxin of toxin-antitoxin system